jgi:glycosyltransferase involved in cell wall biosynthesis
MNKNNPAMSIGMPVYNGDRYIREALDSLLNQTFSDFELIISDNSSTDETQNICKAYVLRDARIKYFRQLKNIGAINNFNYVLNEAVGQYFMWASADDVWDRLWVERLLFNLKADVAISFGRVININSAGIEIKRYPSLGFEGHLSRRLICYYLMDDSLGKANLIYGVYATQTLKPLGFNILCKNEYGRDMIFVFSQLTKGVIVTDNEVTLYKRVYPVRKRDALSRMSSLFIFDRFEHYYAYSKVANNKLTSMIILFLYPFKVMISFTVNLFYTLLRQVRSQEK